MAHKRTQYITAPKGEIAKASTVQHRLCRLFLMVASHLLAVTTFGRISRTRQNKRYTKLLFNVFCCPARLWLLLSFRCILCLRARVRVCVFVCVRGCVCSFIILFRLLFHSFYVTENNSRADNIFLFPSHITTLNQEIIRVIKKTRQLRHFLPSLPLWIRQTPLQITRKSR